MSKDSVTIHIRKALADKISQRIQDQSKGFETFEEYVNYILEEVLNDLEKSEELEEQNKIRDELKKLGYV